MVCAAAAWSASQMPVVAAMLRQAPLVAATPRPPSWAQVAIPRPTEAGIASAPQLEEVATPAPEVPATEAATESSQPGEQPTAMPTEQATQMAAELPSATAAELPTEVISEATSEPPTAEPTWSGSLSMEYVEDTPTSEAAPPAATPASPGDTLPAGAHWIDVDLTQQRLYAYAGNTVVNSFLVSTGTWLHPTVTGQYHIYVKLRYTDMSGPDYYLPNVPYTMYFYQGYGLHGTYWHHNFGTPMSHGCVNLSIPDSAWLYNFSSIGTLVNVHY